MNESMRKALYAAVGAPVVTVRRVNAGVGRVSDRAEKLAGRVGDGARKEYGLWADEGEKVVTQIGDQPVVEDITARVDLDQIQGQVNRLREQLDEMVAAWRESFRPHDQKETVAVEEKPSKAAKKPAAKKPAAKKPAAKKKDASEATGTKTSKKQADKSE